MNDLDSLVKQAQYLFASCTTPADLENAKAQFLGKAGRITEFMKGLAQLDIEEGIEAVKASIPWGPSIHRANGD